MNDSNKNKKKNLATKSNHRGGVQTNKLSYAGNWVKKVLEMPKYKKEKITSVVPTSITDKNYKCCECNKYYKATCKGDIIKHLDGSSHKNKKKNREKNNGKV